MNYDAIVVGARCAGAPTAMLLARRGHRVLLVDKATFPSDTISTHIVWPHGAAIMARWGLLDRLAATGCPPIALRTVFDVGPVVLTGGVFDVNGGRGGYCPRRTVLDTLLVDAAVEAGAELRDAVTIEELLWEEGRVAGARGRTRNGTAFEERGRIVIGADGVHSRVATAVGAREYNTKPILTTYFYSYFSGFEANDLEQHVRPYQGAGVFPTNGNLTLLAGVWPHSRFEAIRSDIEGHVTGVFESIAGLGDRLHRATREDKWFGTAGVANYFRQPYGPGWALVGDAGYDKDPITAQGISDAFIDAEALTTALDEGWSGRRPLEEALSNYHAERDRRVTPMYEFTAQMAMLEPPPPPMQALFAALSTNQHETNRFFSAITGAIPVESFMNPENIGAIVEKSGV